MEVRVLQRYSRPSRQAAMDNRKQLTDYNVYIMSKREKAAYTLISMLVLYIVGFIFYRSWMISLLLCPFAFLYPGVRTKAIIANRKSELNIQFKDMLYSLSSSLSAGKSVEPAFKDVLKDLCILYPDPNTDILKEAGYITRRIEMNETIESALADFAARAHLEDIDNFVDVFHTGKRAGGNIVEIIKNTSNIISDKIEIRQEISTLLAEKKFEQRVLNALPLLIIIVLSISAGDYMEPVFSTAAGRIVMSAAIILLAVSYFISQKIIDIRV